VDDDLDHVHTMALIVRALGFESACLMATAASWRGRYGRNRDWTTFASTA
jgi:hypothetical protein